MTYGRVLLRSSAVEACWRSESLSIAHNFYKGKCFVCTYNFKPVFIIAARSRNTRNTALEGSPTATRASSLWAISWACSFHAIPCSQGRYISAESTEACTCSHREVSACLSFEGPEVPPADNDIALHNDESVGEEEILKKVDNFLVVNFYVLVHIDDPQLEVARHTKFTENKDIRGRILISSQGINAQYSGPPEDVTAYANWVKEDPRFSSLYVQVSPSVDGHAFPRLKLRYKPSLVQVEGGTVSLPITDPGSRAIPLLPRVWKDKLKFAQKSYNAKGASGLETNDACKRMQRPVLLLDVRNGYEWDVGHFKDAQRPPVDSFKSTEFGLQYNEDKEIDPLANVDKENMDILMYCTGGIRCDVYSTMLRQKGFKHLYSLKGGVARYLIEENGENWLGNLFVFDSRLSVPPAAYKQNSDCPKEVDIESANNLQGEVHTKDQSEFCICSLCGGSLSHVRHRNCANIDCNCLFLCCDQCVRELAGCCSTQCTTAPRQRPCFVTPQQYKRWHIYRDVCLPAAARPAGSVGKRAKKRLRGLEKEQKDLQNASLATFETLKEAREW